MSGFYRYDGEWINIIYGTAYVLSSEPEPPPPPAEKEIGFRKRIPPKKEAVKYRIGFRPL